MELKFLEWFWQSNSKNKRVVLQPLKMEESRCLNRQSRVQRGPLEPLERVRVHLRGKVES